MFRLTAALLVLNAVLLAGARLVGELTPYNVLAYTKVVTAGNTDVYLFDTAVRLDFNLTRTRFAYEDYPAWSPDGSQIAYQMVSDYRSQVCILTPQYTCDSSNGWWDHSPRWSVDGQSLAFLSSETILFVRNTTNGAVNRLTTSGNLLYDAAWSPDGTQIAFVEAVVEVTAYAGLRIAGSDLQGVRAIPTAGLQAASPAWSPDGSQIAFTGADAHGRTNVYLVDLAGSSPRQISAGNTDSFPVWSPDGSRLLFLSARDGDLDLYLVNADGSGERALTDNNRTDKTPAWSPDGTRIVFASNQDGRYHLYLYDLAADAAYRLTSDSAVHLNPAWRP